MNRRVVMFLLCLMISLGSLWAVTEETASLRGFIYGSAPTCGYDKWISHVSEGIASNNYNIYAPYDRQTNGFGTFRVASATDLTRWNEVMDAFLAGNLETAEQLILNYSIPYEVVVFHDTDVNRTYYMLRESLNMSYSDDNGTTASYDDEIGSFDYGWGIYVYNPSSTTPVLVNVAHPNDDFIVTPISVLAFQEWDAMFFAVNGAGREVKWNMVAPFYNSKSLSDPSRIEAHAFHKAYVKMCDKIRAQFGRRELATQIHSYDWNRHPDLANCQISAGNGRNNPNLPIRDLSSMKWDLVNETDYLVHPINDLGVHDPVLINDFYTINYSINPFTYALGDSSIAVNNVMDLPGFSDSRQMTYSDANHTDYDINDPFFHVEFDELPNCYQQTTNNYKWFYGYNPVSDSWDYDHLFDKAIAYYSPWLHAMTTTIQHWVQMNDNLTPAAPQQVAVYSQSADYITLQWNPIDSYDFKTYEILYSTQPIDETNATSFTRTNAELLADPMCSQVNVTGLSPNQQYYFKVRAIDYNSNISPLSSEVTAITGPAKVNNLVAVGMDNKVRLTWNANPQNGNLGFIVYRKTLSTDYTPIANWNSDPTLVSTNANQSFTFFDTTVVNGENYTYKIASQNTANVIYPHNFPVFASPRPIFKLVFSANNGTVSDSCAFAINPSATDGNDGTYDVVKATAPTSNFFYSALYEAGWATNGVYLQQEIYGSYDLSRSTKMWTVRFKTDRANTPITVKVSDNYATRQTEKLYLYNQSNSTWTNLATTDGLFTVANANFVTMNLYWGNLQPVATLASSVNKILQAGNTFNLNWTNQYPFLADHISVSLQNGTDSISVAQNLSPTTTSYAWVVADRIAAHNLRIVIDVYALDGQVNRSYSNYLVGVVPQNIAFTPVNGWSMVSNPWTGLSATPTTVFGANSLLYTWENETYSPSEFFLFGHGYWAKTSNPSAFSSAATVQTTNNEQMLSAGWNIVANPHPCTYKTKDLNFKLNNVTYTFGELLEQNIISPAVYTYRNGGYTLVSEIQPFESFFLYSYAEERLTLNVQFVPYQNNPAISSADAGKSVTILASQLNQDADDITIGLSPRATNSFDFEYDLPEAPAKPFSNGLEFYIDAVEPFPHTRLNSFFEGPLSDATADTLICPISLRVNSLDPITLSVVQSNLPENYLTRVIIDGHVFVPENGEFTFIPSQASLLTGYAKIFNQFVGSEDPIAPTALTLTNYPNPFNPMTTIRFQNPKDSKVEVVIFNIKGQKVRGLLAENSKAGTHELTWDGKDSNGRSVASGMYLISVKAGDKHLIKKAMLLK